MECLLGIACKDFVMIAADMMKIQSILVMKETEDKMTNISDNIVMGVCGDAGDATQFSEYIAKNIKLYKMMNGYDLSPHAAANFTRHILAEYLRSRTPYNVNLLLAGRDKKSEECELYFCDYLASLVKVPHTSHGYGGLFASSIMDRYHRKDMTVEEGYELMVKCVTEIQKRLVVNLSNFKVRIITKDGIKDLEDITAAKIAKAAN